MAATHHHHFNYAPSTAGASASDQLNMLSLRDVVFIAPPSSMHQQNPPIPSSAPADHPHLSSSAALGVGVSIFPLLAATPCVPNSSTVEVIGTDQQGSNFLRIRDDPSFAKKDAAGIGAERLDDGGASGGSLKVCRDCGNRAKKECGFRRCRTCCKSRGYDCATHVKSTWVPAARRRERQVAITFGGSGGGGGGSSGSSSGGPKKQRIEFGSSRNAPTNASSTSNSATPRSFDATPFRQDAGFKRSLPRQVRAPAIFRCIRVTAISGDSAEVAYQATVSISGHVFKGYLYDHGSRGKNSVSCTSQIRFEQGNGNANPADTFAASGCRRLIEGEDD